MKILETPLGLMRNVRVVSSVPVEPGFESATHRVLTEVCDLIQYYLTQMNDACVPSKRITDHVEISWLT